jgi:hypothetical protein
VVLVLREGGPEQKLSPGLAGGTALTTNDSGGWILGLVGATDAFYKAELWAAIEEVTTCRGDLDHWQRRTGWNNASAPCGSKQLSAGVGPSLV